MAFPNKFLEYVQSGMHIIATPFVYEIAQQIKDYSLGILYNLDGNIKGIVDYLNNDSTNKSEYSPRLINEVLNYNSFENRLPALVSDII